MIDFRYHLVSLISVFLALAVGIALGAGPLKEAIGDTLTGQVDVLRDEKDALRADLTTVTVERDRVQASFEAVAPGLLAGVLDQRRVAVVQVADVDPEVRAQVVERLGQAGAEVTATVTVTDEWTDPDRRSYRQSIAGTLVEYLDPAPAQDAGTGTELAEALTQALTAAEPTGTDLLSEEAGIVLELLTDSGLITTDALVTVPADAIVVLAGPTASTAEVLEAVEALPSPTAQEEDTAALEARLEVAFQIVVAAQARSDGTVLAGGELGDPSVVLRVRQDESAAGRISTVESVHTVAGQVSIPLALSARIAGTVGHYGTGTLATAPMPPHVVLPPIERVPAELPPVEPTPVQPTPPADGAINPDGTVEEGAATDGTGADVVTEGATTDGSEAAVG